MDISHAATTISRALLGFGAKDDAFRREVIRAATILSEQIETEEYQPESTQIAHVAGSRCRLKADAAAWAASRVRLTGASAKQDNPEVRALHDELLLRAENQQCFLWMLDASFAVADPASLDQLSGCFSTLADAIELVNDFHHKMLNDRRTTMPFLQLVATAQSALKEAIVRVGGPDDAEQLTVFHWIKTAAQDSGLFIKHHMRQDDAAEPTTWPSNSQRIQNFRLLRNTELDRIHKREWLFDDLLGLTNRLPDADALGSIALWDEIVEVIGELLGIGVQPTSVDLRDMLGPHIAKAPDSISSQEFGRVREVLESQLRTHIRVETKRAASLRSQQVDEVAALLRGRSVVLIGGDERPHHKAAITDQFGLKDLIWIPTKHGTPVKSFETHVANSDVAVVVLMIRWASHAFGDVEQYCKLHGKPLVRLPGGYSTNQIAQQIVNQCSDRLRLILEETTHAK